MVLEWAGWGNLRRRRFVVISLWVPPDMDDISAYFAWRTSVADSRLPGPAHKEETVAELSRRYDRFITKYNLRIAQLPLFLCLYITTLDSRSLL